MKTQLVLFLFYLFSISVAAQELRSVETYYDILSKLKIKESYTTLNEPPYLKHGKYTMYDERGLKSVELEYKNGKPDGIGREYYLPGYGLPGDERLKTVTHFVDGKEHGSSITYTYILNGEVNLKGEQMKALEQEYENGKLIHEVKYYINRQKEYDNYLVNGPTISWYPNGQKKEEATMSNEKPNGGYSWWFENGQLGKSGKFVNGKQDSQWNYFDESGFQELVENWQAGTLMESTFHFGDGSKETRTLVDGSTNYLMARYLANGTKILEAEVASGEAANDPVYVGSYKSWYENGKPKTTGGFKIESAIPVRDGYWSTVEVSGDTLSAGYYKSGIRIGKWKIFYDDQWNEVNDLTQALYFRVISFDESGQPLGQVQDYYINGQLQMQGSLLSVDPEVLNGKCTFYYQSGQKESEGEYWNGVKIGKWTNWHENGQIHEIANFITDKRTATFGTYESALDGNYYQYNADGSLSKVITYSNGQKVQEYTGDEFAQAELNMLKTQLSDRFNNFETSRDEVATYYNYKATDNQKFIFNKAMIVKSEYLESALNCTDKECVLSNSEKLDVLVQRLWKLKDENTSKLELKLKLTNSPDKIKEILGI